MRRFLCFAALISSVAHLGPSVGWSADDQKTSKPDTPRSKPSSPAKTPMPLPTQALADSAEVEAEAMALVRRHLPELAQVLEPLKTTNPPEYRKAITDLAAEARTLTTLQSKNPARFDLALDAWKARTRVELIAAQLAGAPSPERESQLRAAIETRVDVEIRRHRFEAEQAEAAVVRVRENLTRVEANRDRARDALNRAEGGRDAKVEARYRALLPKKVPSTATKPPPKSSLNTAPPPSPALSDNDGSIPPPRSPIGGNSR